MKISRRIRLYTCVCKIDDDLLERSRVAQAGRSLIQLAIFVRGSKWEIFDRRMD